MSTVENTLVSERCAGVLLHPTSLPGPGPVGRLGADARRFIIWLQAAGFRFWQVLPLHPPQDDSPYSCMSVFAGDERLIDPAELRSADWLPEVACAAEDLLQSTDSCLRQARHHVESARTLHWDRYQRFLADNADWLEPYALFRVLREEFGGRSWQAWPEELAQLFLAPAEETLQRQRIAHITATRARQMEEWRFAQYVFFAQWRNLVAFAHRCGVRILGDMPLYVDLNSSDVWSYPELFDLDAAGLPRTVAGVPPDYFSSTGQRWGNPQYRWERIAEDGFRWWVRRTGWALTAMDGIRIDHFRGIEAFWSIPASTPTAIDGQWVPGPGAAFFEALQNALGTLPLVAEDLGTITEEVEQLRDRFGLPGMKILQFAFDGNPDNPYLPHQHVPHGVVYTGTHDNDTLCGWFSSLEPWMQERILVVLDQGTDVPGAMIRAVLHSPAQLAIIPLQDLLALGSEHRMNTPGTVAGNWSWRFSWDWIPESLASEVYAWNRAAGRLSHANPAE